ncbi:PARVB protein, partial [Leiothrix lutea]|nr:PARVB protein [Leiothrix lutea]
MSAAPVRSPVLRPHRMKKEESFLGKLGGTLARKKKAKEVSDLQEEGKNAINAPMNPSAVDIHPEDTLLEENEERTMIDPNSKEDPKFKELIKVLIDWINDVLVEERIIVKQLEEDLYDGQVLQKLLEKCLSQFLENYAKQRQPAVREVSFILKSLAELPVLPVFPWRTCPCQLCGSGPSAMPALGELCQLSLELCPGNSHPCHFCPRRKREGLLQTTHVSEELTTTTEMMMGRFERDAFDTLFDHAPDKLSVVKKSLITFVNKHLNKLNLEVTELETQFADGVYLVLLMGLLEDYFVPLHNFYLTPESFDQKV